MRTSKSASGKGLLRSAKIQLFIGVVATALAVLPRLCFGEGSLYPNDTLSVPYKTAAQYILRQVPAPHRGYCFVFGSGEGRLAYELRRQSEYTILGAEEDRKKLDRGRRILHEADLYGQRITLQRSSLTKLRYRGYAAALVAYDSIIADGTCSGSAAEMFRMIRPDGGMAIIGQPPGCPRVLGRDKLEAWLKASGVSYAITENPKHGLWAVVSRGPLPGAGEWTHVRADVANTNCSGDTLSSNQVKVLWFGEPGPAVMVDRHWRAAPSLYKNGRLFVAGFDRIICSDAYNGGKLWDLSVPKSARIAMTRDAGWMALADDSLYVAKEGDCLKVDVRSGTVARTFHTPTKGRDWGYLATEGDLLYGSEQAPGASYLAATTGRGNKGLILGRGDNRFIITSTSLFCMDRNTGNLKWRYQPEKAGVIANVTVCIGKDGVYFFESTAATATAAANGRVKLAAFTHETGEHLVKLDKRKGTMLWRHQREMPCEHVLQLCYGKDVVFASGSTTRSKQYWYHARAFHAQDGSPVWEQDFDSSHASKDTAHGKQDKHPLIIGDAVYYKQGNFDLATGRPLGFTFKTSDCSESTSSAKHIFRRCYWAVSMFRLGGKGKNTTLSYAMRPGCYSSIIPAGGIIMLPPASAGCMCDHSIQTTVTWMPR